MYATLQTCRGFAALLVVFFHLGGTIALAKYFGINGFSRFFSFGHAGVDFFFVLSGFIIVHVHRKDFGHPSRLGNYLKKRAIRIYPVYWLVFSGVYFVALPFPSLRDTLPHDFLDIFRSLMLVPRDPSVVGGTGAQVLIVAWSLQYEIMFYATVALSIFNRPLGFIGIMAIGLVYLLQSSLQEFPFSFFQKSWIILFIFGGFTALLNTSTVRIHFPLTLSFAGLTTFLLMGFFEPKSTGLQANDWTHLVYGFASACMVLGLVRAESKGRADMLKPSWATLLGDASYALYLIHFPLISIICKASIAIGLTSLGGAWITFLAGLTICLAVSIAFHVWIERPLLRYLARLVVQPSPRATC